MMSDPNYEAYLSLLTRFLRLSPSQRDEIRRELRAHMEEAIEAQLECGVPRDEAVRRALEDFGDAAELAARFSSIGSRRRWIMKGTAAAACIGFVALGFNNLSTWLGGPSPASDMGVTHVETAAQRPERSDDDDLDRRIFEALEKRVPEVSFEQIPLEQVLDFIAEITGIKNFHVQWSRLEEDGIERDMPISMKFSDLSAERLLRFVLSEARNNHADLQYAVIDGILFISTPDGFRRNTQVEVYDVQDLLARGRSMALPGAASGGRRASHKMLTDVYRLPPPPSTPAVRRTVSDGGRSVEYNGEFLTKLVSKIRQSVRPNSWDDPSDGTFIEVNPLSGRLVVCNTADAHAQIGAFLERTFPWVTAGFSHSEDDSIFERLTSTDPGEELVDMIQNAIAPDSWQANGGTEYVQVYQGSLIVRQSEAVHAELGRLLAALREPRKD